MKTSKRLLAWFAAAGILAAPLVVSCAQASGSSSGSSGTATSSGNGAGLTTAGAKTAGYAAVARFDSLTDAQCEKAKNLKIFFQHASVGGNVYDGLMTLAGSDAKFAIPTKQADVPGLKAWLGANAGWGDFNLGNPGWAAKISNFRTNITTSGIGTAANVAMMKMCYIDNEASFADYRDAMLELEKANPSVAFVWWTMPIMTAGMAQRDAYNAAVRSYAATNGKWLFDIADIECHDAAGKKLADSGGYETLCADYTTDGGHLNAIGQARVAKAMWALLADIAAAK